MGISLKLRLSILGLVALGVLSGCASAPTKAPSVSNDIPLTEETNAPLTPFSIEQIVSQYAMDQDKEALEKDLVRLSEIYLDAQDCLSIEIIMQMSEQLELTDERAAMLGVNDIECHIKRYESTENKYSTRAKNLLVERLALFNSRFNSNPTLLANTDWAARVAFIETYFLATAEAQYSKALLQLADLGTEITGPLAPLSQALTFQWVGELTQSDRAAVARIEPDLFEYVQVYGIIEDESLTDAQRQQVLLAWMQDNPTATLSVSPTKSIQRLMDIPLESIQNIAVLLPLSGRLQGQGDAIKQGVLAGYYELSNNTNTSLNNARVTFIDTGSQTDLAPSVTAERLAEYSVVMGPLLKSHLEPVDSLAKPDTLRIFLNTNDETVSANTSMPTKHFFSLSPEQEARALANKMLRNNIRHPVLIYDESNITTRMSKAFLDAWAQGNSEGDMNSVSQVQYTDNNAMRAGIRSALDVLQSQQRINQMSNLIDEEVYSVTRNRRDVDAFVVFARPNEVELINPIIESSMSLFSGEQLPVFATSYSYNHKQNRNSLRDLRNLVFVDMPFVLPQGRDTQLSVQVDELFNEPSSTFLRLFSFGYDAIQLTPHLLTTRLFPQLSKTGLSGQLSIDERGIVQRELSALSIQNN